MNNIGTQNSRNEILLGVIRNLLVDIATAIESRKVFRGVCNLKPRVEMARDFDYILSRTQHEGTAFLTQTLPRLGKWYDSILAGQTLGMPEGFKPFELRDGVPVCPVFCRTLMYVIQAESIPTPEKAWFIRAFRSLFYLFYKMEEPLSKEAEKLALDNWLSREEELEFHSFPSYYDRDLIEARSQISSLLTGADDAFVKIHPQHGPGAVAGGERGDEKWETINSIRSLHSVYPFAYYALGQAPDTVLTYDMCEMIRSMMNRGKRIDPVSKLLFVPKDSRGPRTISCEPKELMFIQQGVARNLMRVFHSRSHGRINFEDQTINAKLALASSLSQEFATIDLRDASDRLSTELVISLFPERVARYLHATRSTHTKLPDGTVQSHFKYAPMGSAMCFPIQSAVFWALAVSAGIRSGLTASAAQASTYVYGDDIIIRPEVFPVLLEIFSKVGLEVNIGKSYVEGPFRESCGIEAWNGQDITAFRIKKDLRRRSLNGPLADAVCKYSSKCFALDFRETGEHLFTLVNRDFPGVIRSQFLPLGCLHVIDPLAHGISNYRKSGYSVEQCSIWVEGWVLITPKEPSTLDGLSRFLKYHYGKWEMHDPGQVAVPRAAKIRKRRTRVEVPAAF